MFGSSQQFKAASSTGLFGGASGTTASGFSAAQPAGLPPVGRPIGQPTVQPAAANSTVSAAPAAAVPQMAAPVSANANIPQVAVVQTADSTGAALDRTLVEQLHEAAAAPIPRLTDEQQREKARELDAMLNQMTGDLDLRLAEFVDHADALNFYDRYFLENQTQFEMFNNELNTLEAEAQRFADDVELLTEVQLELKGTLGELAERTLSPLQSAANVEPTGEEDEADKSGKPKILGSTEARRKQILQLANSTNVEYDQVENQLQDAIEMLANLQQTEERIQESDYDEPVLSQIKDILKLQCTNLQQVENETDALIERIQGAVSKLSILKQS